MKKLFLLVSGLVFLVSGASGQISDSAAILLAEEKMAVFTGLLEQLAAPGLDMATRKAIRQTLEADFIRNSQTRFDSDISPEPGRTTPVEASSYFTRLPALFPLGASLKSTDFQTSAIHFSPEHQMYYITFRCRRTFRGHHALSRKEVATDTRMEYRVSLSEGGRFGIRILSGRRAEGGSLPEPEGDRQAEKNAFSQSITQAETEAEKAILNRAQLLLALARNRTAGYRNQVQSETSGNAGGKDAAALRKAGREERERLSREIKKEKDEAESLTFHRVKIRLGFGYLAADSGLNSLPVYIEKHPRHSWYARADMQLRVAGLRRLPDGTRPKAHTAGFFLNCGRQSAAQVRRLHPEPGVAAPSDSTRPSRLFIEAEAGIMLREELRLSGGAGFMQTARSVEGNRTGSTTAYYSFTAGLSPRLTRWLEMDFSFSGLLLNGRLRPRAAVSLVLVANTRRK